MIVFEISYIYSCGRASRVPFLSFSYRPLETPYRSEVSHYQTHRLAMSISFNLNSPNVERFKPTRCRSTQSLSSSRRSFLSKIAPGAPDRRCLTSRSSSSCDLFSSSSDSSGFTKKRFVTIKCSERTLIFGRFSESDRENDENDLPQRHFANDLDSLRQHKTSISASVDDGSASHMFPLRESNRFININWAPRKSTFVDFDLWPPFVQRSRACFCSLVGWRYKVVLSRTLRLTPQTA